MLHDKDYKTLIYESLAFLFTYFIAFSIVYIINCISMHGFVAYMDERDENFCTTQIETKEKKHNQPRK